MSSNDGVVPVELDGRQHALVIGGTGMLRDVCKELCKVGNTVTIVARGEDRLKLLADECKHLTGSINLLEVDYTNVIKFCALIDESQDAFGSFDIVISWIHDDSTITPAVAQSINDHMKRNISSDKHIKFYRIRGSRALDPGCDDITRNKEAETVLATCRHLDYHEIVLGFVIEVDGSSRFNTNEEISEGVLLFLRQSGGNFAKVGSSMKSIKIFVVGVVRPWNKRPP